ncbi:MAG: hypothetical protein GF390_01320 [Candidatus Pacebacteria bacterium]|nr:hypothetical protein [Candidatus Paceibacterota bacterium]
MQQNNQQHQPFFKEKWFFILLAVSFVVVIVSVVFKLFTPPTPKLAPAQDNSWQGITPGFSDLADVQAKMGEPIKIEKTTFGTKLQYRSKYPTMPHEIQTNQQGEVQFIKQYLDYENPENINDYQGSFGEADLELFMLNNSPLKAYIYLDKGVVILAHSSDGAVEQKWYFTPTTKKAFLQSWGKNLSKKGSGPEEFNP